MRHIQSFNSAAEVQAALNNEELGNPYVALVSGSGLDYNTLEPVPPVTGERKIEITFLPSGRGNYMLWNNIDAIPLDYAEWVDENSETHILHAGDSPSVEFGVGGNDYKVTYHLTGNSIGPNAFRGITCVAGVEIFGGVEYLGSYSFAGLVPNPAGIYPIDIILHEGVKEIGYNDEGSEGYWGRTFEGFSACTSVTIPSTVTLINTNSFSNFEGTIFIFRGLTPPTFSMSESTDLGTDANVYVPHAAYQAYDAVLGPYLDGTHINTLLEYDLLTLGDSEGNTYYIEYKPNQGSYFLEANLDVDSTWTLYKNGQVLTVGTVQYGMGYICLDSGNMNLTDQGVITGLTCENIDNADLGSIPSYDQTYYTCQMDYSPSEDTLMFAAMYYQSECGSSSSS